MMKYDLHCHTHCSDGTLTPEQLIDLAFERDIDVLAITDHDSVMAYSDFPPGRCVQTGAEAKTLMLVSGCEFSALWNGCLVHILGLDFDIQHLAVTNLLARSEQMRRERSQKIADALERVGISGALVGATKFAGSGIPGRPHFARYLVEIGVVPNEKKAFKKYLGKGKTGDIKTDWPALKEVVEVITEAGGVSVIAHPAHYDLTRTKLLRLVEDFKCYGGRAIEVISGKQPANQVQQLVEIANTQQLLCSLGSDFHKPNQPWADLGKVADLPSSANPVWGAFPSLT